MARDDKRSLIKDSAGKRVTRREFLAHTLMLGVSASAAGSVLAACGGSKASPPSATKSNTSNTTKSGGKKTTVTVLAPADTGLDPVWKQQARMFEKENPDITIKFTYVPWNNMPQKQQSEMLIHKLQDVFLINQTGYSPGQLQNLILKGKAAPVSDYVDISDLKLQSKFAEPAKYKGKLYAVPFEGYGWCAYLNPALFKKYGISTPSEDWTVDDDLKLVKQFQDKAGAKGGKINLSGPYLFDDRYGSFWTGYREWFFNQNQTSVDLTRDDLKSFFTYSVERNNYVPRSGEFKDTWAQAFADGNQPIFYDATYAAGAVIQLAPFEVQVVPWPRSGVQDIRTFTSANYWLLNSESQVKEQAAKFIHFTMKPPAAKVYIKQGKYAPTDAIKPEQYKGTVPKVKNPQNNDLPATVAKLLQKLQSKSTPPDRDLKLFAKGLDYDKMSTVWSTVVMKPIGKHQVHTYDDLVPLLQKTTDQFEKYVDQIKNK